MCRNNMAWRVLFLAMCFSVSAHAQQITITNSAPQTTDDFVGRAKAAVSLGNAALEKKDWNAARTHFEAAAVWYEQGEDHKNAAGTRQLAERLAAREKLAAQAQLSSEAAQAAAQAGNAGLAVEHLEAAAQYYEQLGENENAEAMLLLSEKLRGYIDPSQEAARLSGLGDNAAARGNKIGAADFYQRAIKLYQDIDDWHGENEVRTKADNLIDKSAELNCADLDKISRPLCEKEKQKVIDEQMALQKEVEEKQRQIEKEAEEKQRQIEKEAKEKQRQRERKKANEKKYRECMENLGKIGEGGVKAGASEGVLWGGAITGILLCSQYNQ